MWQNIIFLLAIILGGVLPYLIRRRVLGDGRWIHLAALAVLVGCATIAGSLLFWLFRNDFWVTFTRIFVVDGFSLYVLNYPPLQGR